MPTTNEDPFRMTDELKGAGDVRWITRQDFLQSVAVYRGSNKSIATATDTVIDFDNEDHDTNTLHDNSSNNGRLIVAYAGVYACHFECKWSGSSTTGSRVARIRKNGTTVVHNEIGNLPGFNVAQHISVVARMAVGDYFDTLVTQNSGGGLNIIGAVDGTKFDMFRVA